MQILAERQVIFDSPTDTFSGVILQMASLEVEKWDAEMRP
jgi:hypothetical protein